MRKPGSRFLLLITLLSPSYLLAQHTVNQVVSRDEKNALSIQNQMIKGVFSGRGDDCSDAYSEQKATIERLIQDMSRKDSGKVSSNYNEKLAYLLALKGRCEKDNGSMKEAMRRAQAALDQNPLNTNALAIVAKTINGFKTKQSELGGPKGYMMGRAAKGLFSDFKSYFEVYLRGTKDSKEAGSMFAKIQAVYVDMST